ncbi:hypothetical protein F53441_12599 [Fusarium austroafricanum]|uniref:Uncharacterized protein n=1 Tax=Fusarium austroafricanum TaxID=2364996 RepID=A0A8H4JUX2_9HYPO|nr:hypothetical protein F53441_12599 [Fusarium austroafricanum]
MSNTEQENKSEYIPGGKRPFVSAYTQVPSFRVGDSVYLLKSDGSREGPYIVAVAPSAGKCVLSYTDGRPFQDNAGVSVDELEAS